jgi:hypothetical protein
MATSTSLESTITQKLIEPALEFTQLQPYARDLGYDITEGFHEGDFKKFEQQLFRQYIAPLIQTYVNSDEAQQLDSRASTLDITAIFEPKVEEHLRKKCKILSGRWDGYGPANYTFWNWVVTFYPFNKWFTTK